MPPSFGTTQGSSQGGIDQNDRHYTADEGMNCSLLKDVFFQRGFSKQDLFKNYNQGCFHVSVENKNHSKDSAHQ